MPSFFTPDFGLLFWMLLAFVVVYVLLSKFGFPVITKMVDDRKTYIDESLQHAREANEKLAHIAAESDAILKEARDQQSKMVKEAMATREGIISEAKNKAQIEGRKMLDDAKLQIQAEKENALRDIRTQVAGLSVQVAEKILLKKLEDDKAQTELVEQLIEDAISSK